MIRLGRVYRGLMIDVQATNAKLSQRKKEMLRYLTTRNDAAINNALARANGNVKIAVLLLHGCDPAKAEALLSSCRGRLRAALARMQSSG